MTRGVSFREYVREILNTARYEPCESGSGFVAVADVLPGCMTQGETLEDTRDLLIDAIETWILSAIKDGETLPVVKGSILAVAGQGKEPGAAYA